MFLFFLFFLFFEHTRPTESTMAPLASSTSLLAMRPFCAFRAKKSLHTGVRTGCHYLISLSVCVRVCVTFVVFTDCESCTRPISTNPVPMEAGEYGLTRGTCFAARRLHVIAVAGLMWVSWCFWVGRDVFVLFMSFHFQIRRPRAVSVESAKGLRQPANLPTANSRPPVPTRCTV